MITKVHQLKPFIGRKIEWEYAHDHHRGTCLVGRGRLEGVQGRNVIIDGDYRWFPDLRNLRILPEKGEEYFTDYPTEPIGGDNPYYRCAACGVSDPQINGSLDGHRDDCAWANAKRKERQ